MNKIITFMKKIIIALAIVISGLQAWAGGPAASVPVTGTLPVVYVNTKDNAPVVNKDDEIEATIYIDPCGADDVEPFGSAENPVAFTLSGRGNSSWTDFDKKPYKIKFGKKQTPLGFPAHKTFALLAHAPAPSYMSCEASAEIARLFDIGWVPRTHPVELVLNGVNLGTYAFSETVKIAKGRLDIAEQPDNNTDPATIADGWLIEIDNYDDTPQIKVFQNETCTPSDEYWPRSFTIKTPEELSPLQEEWITDQLRDITMEVHSDPADDTWMRHFDIPRLARYYLVQELSCNYDAFVGSTYFYYTADAGKWMAGPLWDSEWTFGEWEMPVRFGHFWEERNYYIPVDSHPENKRPVWIDRMFEHPTFRNAVLKEWRKFYPDKMDGLMGFVADFYNKVKESYRTNALIWPQYSMFSVDSRYEVLMTKLPIFAKWLDGYLHVSLTGIGAPEADTVEISYPVDVYNASGMKVRRVLSADELHSLPAGLYIAAGKKFLIGAK